MDVFALASGSSGNAYVVRSGDTTLLVESGIPLRRIVEYLARHRLTPSDLAGVLITHEHSDHSRSARQLSDRFGIPLYATQGTLGHASLRDAARARVVAPGRPVVIGDLEVHPFAVPHDAREPVGYRLVGADASVCITTDLGFVPDAIIPNLRNNDLLVLEANHDEGMLRDGPYPYVLKRRVLGPHGHLSNRATGDALVACGDRVPSNVWLAHLSQVNNTPNRARATVAERLTSAGLSHVQVEIARRHQPSLRWTSGPRLVQMALF